VVVQTSVQGFLPGTILSYRIVVGGSVLQGDTEPPVLGACRSVDSLGTCMIDSFIENKDFTKGCLPYAGIIMVGMCIPGQVTIIDGDGTGPRTRVYAISSAWAPIAMLYFVR
jgi:hypothetical protein